ncbi:alpha/beta fold hydrolase [Haliangium sp.]|uniref:S9 family peptidase n=1 Tax=Haliangium sp. TaxID=2663208 RepID=UPI003D09CA09
MSRLSIPNLRLAGPSLRLAGPSLLLAGLVLAGCAGPLQSADKAGPPPLIDRALFFGDPVITAAQISPDGKHIAFIKPYRGVRNIWVKTIDQSFDEAKPLTADERPVPGYFWSRDSARVLYVQDKGGNENFHIYAVNPAAAPDASTGVPPARNLTDIEGVRAMIYDVPKKAPGTIMVGLNDRDPAHHDVYRIDIATGERTLVMENTHKVLFWVFDNEGALRLAARQTEGGGQEILRVSGSELVPIYTTTMEETAAPLRFHPDGRRVYVRSNKGDEVDLTRLMLMDVASGQTELIESDPEGEVDLGGALFDERDDSLFATVYVGDQQRVYGKTDEARRDIERLREKFPDANLNINSITEDMSMWLVNVSSDVDPGSAYLYRRDSGDAELLYRSRPELPSEHLATMEPVRYQARDGLEIPAYLTLPKGMAAKGLPTVIFPHGGPWARDTWGYDPFAQFLANRGYAVLQPNFRASTGYGKRFLNAGNHEWGTGAMQHDLTDGVRWLIDRGIADPARVCIFGGSYGGYATLAGVAFTPDLYKCGIPYVAPSNLITLMESFPPYWRPFLEGTFYGRVGDPADPAEREDLLARSPLQFVDRIRVPLLVVHGANDPRVKQSESDQIVVALREKGHAVEYIVAPDEGHGFRGPENRMALAVAAERFLAKHLGGRAQVDVATDTAQRLAAITVDVNTVTMPDRSGAAAAMTAPLPTANGGAIQAGEMSYAVNLQMGPQKMDLTMTRTIAESEVDGRACWRISDSVQMPMGTQTDTFDVDRATLLPVQRKASGMGSIDLVYGDDAITGKLVGMGQSMDVNVALEAPVFGEGPGLVAAIAGLPLAEGYKTTYRQLDVLSQKVQAFALTVTGTETTKVPAGSFETFVVEIEPLGDATGGGTLRVLAAAPHHVVKADYRLPANMGGGTMSSQLTDKK